MNRPAVDRLARLATQLVQIPSVNPMGASLRPELHLEARVTDFLERFAGELGLPWERHEVEPGRDNLLMRFDASAGAPTLMLEVHQDTVPVDGMTIDPFGGEQRDGRLYGRGACDVKGGMATILGVLERLVAERPRLAWNVVAAFTINEEFGFSGARRLREMWQEGGLRLLTGRPDAIVVTEPTECHVVRAHKGVTRWRLTTRGRSVHSSQPQRGENAIFRMARVLSALETYAQQLAASSSSHPLLGPPTLSVGMIRGGISANTVPDACQIEIDRRLLPDEEPVGAQTRVMNYLKAQLNSPTWIRVDAPFMSSRGLSDRNNGVWGQLVQQLACAEGVESRIEAADYGTDATELSADGAPTVVFGPGCIQQAHTADEWIDLGQLETAAAILYRLCQTQLQQVKAASNVGTA